MSAADAALLTAEPVPSGRPTAWRLLIQNRVAAPGLALVAGIVVIVLAAPFLPLLNPDVTDVAHRLRPPFTAGHFLGTDQVGRDILARLIWGTRLSLAVGVTAALAAAAIGSLIGLSAAFYGGLVDNLLMRGIDMLMAFPYLLLALAIGRRPRPRPVQPPCWRSIVRQHPVLRPRRARRDAVDRALPTSWRRRSSRVCRTSASWRPKLFPNVLPGIVIGVSTTIGWMILETAGAELPRPSARSRRRPISAACSATGAI